MPRLVSTFLMMSRVSGLAAGGGFLRKAADSLRAASSGGAPPPPALKLDGAPSWDALQQALDAQTSKEEVELAKQVAEGRGPPTAKANLRLFDAPDGYEPRVTLYRDGASWCPYCQKVWMQLEEKRIPYKVERINMRCYGSKPAWFEQETGGLLPVVRLDGDLITDSVQIMFALERAFEEESLLPPGGIDAIRDLMSLESQHAGAWLGWLRAPPGTGGAGKATYERVLTQMDGALASTSGGFFLGEELSLVDLLFCSFLERAEASLLYYKGFRVRDVEKYPHVCGWFAAMEGRPSFRASQSDYYTHAMDLPPPPTMDEAPDTPPSDWQPTRLGISYRPCRLAVEYVSAGKAFRKLMPVARSSSDATPEGVLSGLENDFGAYLDFDEKLSRSQALRLVEMLLASAA